MRKALVITAFLLTLPYLEVLNAEPLSGSDVAGVPGIDPIAVPMTQDQMESFFNQQKKGMPIELTLERGKVIKGLFSSYDDYYETVWIVPRNGEKGVFSQKGYKLAGIRKVTPWDVKAENAASGFAVFASTSGGAGNTDEYILKKSEAR